MRIGGPGHTGRSKNVRTTANPSTFNKDAMNNSLCLNRASSTALKVVRFALTQKNAFQYPFGMAENPPNGSAGGVYSAGNSKNPGVLYENVETPSIRNGLVDENPVPNGPGGAELGNDGSPFWLDSAKNRFRRHAGSELLMETGPEHAMSVNWKENLAEVPRLEHGPGTVDMSIGPIPEIGSVSLKTTGHRYGYLKLVLLKMVLFPCPTGGP
jgi:hypothetical protein